MWLAKTLHCAAGQRVPACTAHAETGPIWDLDFGGDTFRDKAQPQAESDDAT